MKDLEEIEWELMCQEVKKKTKKRKKIKSKELTEFEITTLKREIEEKKNIKKNWNWRSDKVKNKSKKRIRRRLNKRKITRIKLEFNSY